MRVHANADLVLGQLQSLQTHAFLPAKDNTCSTNLQATPPKLRSRANASFGGNFTALALIFAFGFSVVFDHFL